MPGSTTIALPAPALCALDVLERAGYEAWCVGGFVRDALRGAPDHDIDITSSAPWPEAARLFREAGYTVHETGTDFGTITVVVQQVPIEITRFRADGVYEDARHPRDVSFVGTIEEDLARRDFTINAMAFHPQRGLRDPFGGQQDLRAQRIRAVGDPATRFQEDALRILRGLRLASQIGFALDAATADAMQQNAALLDHVARERVRAELERLLLGDGACDVLVSHWRVLAQVLPELAPMASCPQNTPFHIYNVLEHTAHVVQESPATPLSRWAALFHDSGKPQCRTVDANGRDHFMGHAGAGAAIAREALQRLKAPTHLTEDVSLLVLRHERYAPDTDANVLRALRSMREDVDLYRALLQLQIADNKAKAPGVTQRSQAAHASAVRLESLLDRQAPYTVGQLTVNGSDLIAQGWQPGPALGEMLSDLLDQVIDGQLPNSREALLAYASIHR